MVMKKAAKKVAPKVAKRAAKKGAAKKGVAKKANKKALPRSARAEAPKAHKPAKKIARKRASGSAASLSPRGYRDPRLRIRMYRHGLGDCLLLRFARESGEGTFNVLIDCGLISVASQPKEKMTAVVEDIAEACDNRIDIVVMTHEHWDHASGFSKQQVQAAFNEIDVREVWYAWTEDPTNDLGQKLRKERAAKVKAVSMAAQALAGISANPMAARRSQELGNVLGFFGVDLAAAKAGKGTIGKTREAFEYLAQRPGVRVRYRHPQDAPYPLPGVEGVRVYTFGPPEDEVLLKKSRPTKSGREVYELSAELNVTTNLDRAFDRLAAGGGGATAGISDCPFDESCHARHASPQLAQLQVQTWNAPGEEWRRIELDWTQAAETLAINLDSHTNNSCLVLAFEFVDTGEVFLFPADAQIGNWLSWADLRWKVRNEDAVEWVTAHELLARTVFYKVGHHGSHNATLRALGLELMTNEDLTAFIPVMQTEALKNRWKEMPFNPLVSRLKQKTRGRLLRTDDESAPKAAALAQLTAQERGRFSGALKEGEDKLYYELSFG